MKITFIEKENFFDERKNFYPDNDERIIFFCKGVIEMVKKLGWTPDIIHCNDWISSLIPVYLKNIYKNDPTFKNAKSIFTIYDTCFEYKFNLDDLLYKIGLKTMKKGTLKHLESADLEGFIRIGASYADFTIKSTKQLNENLNEFFKDFSPKNIDTIEKTETYFHTYLQLYLNMVKPS